MFILFLISIDNCLQKGKKFIDKKRNNIVRNYQKISDKPDKALKSGNYDTIEKIVQHDQFKHTSNINNFCCISS